MVYYEIKKIFGSWGSKMALMLLAVTVVISCWSAVNGRGTSWVNEQGHEENGLAAIAKLKSARKEWAGPLDTERFTAVLKENQRINATPEAQSKDDDLNDIAYGWKQGISDIREVINQFLSPDFSTYSYYVADSVSVSALPGIYDNRVKLLQTWLYEKDSSQYDLYSQEEKQWLIQQYQALEAPMEYDYHLGWKQLAETSPTIIMLMSMILGYLVSGIFANEFRWKADSIYFSAPLGRNAATWAKIQAGFLLVTAAYWACMLGYTLYTLIYLGFDGWDCPVQLARWKCFYNLTFLEQYLLILLGGYLGNLFSAFLAMWISAKTKTALIAVTLPFLLIFLPNFFQNYEGSLVGKLLGLMPDRLLQINYAINYFDLYSVGKLVIGAIPVLFVVYFVITAALVPLMYREFCRKEIL